MTTEIIGMYGLNIDGYDSHQIALADTVLHRAHILIGIGLFDYDRDDVFLEQIGYYQDLNIGGASLDHDYLMFPKLNIKTPEDQAVVLSCYYAVQTHYETTH